MTHPFSETAFCVTCPRRVMQHRCKRIESNFASTLRDPYKQGAGNRLAYGTSPEADKRAETPLRPPPVSHVCGVLLQCDDTPVRWALPIASLWHHCQQPSSRGEHPPRHLLHHPHAAHAAQSLREYLGLGKLYRKLLWALLLFLFSRHNALARCTSKVRLASGRTGGSAQPYVVLVCRLVNHALARTTLRECFGALRRLCARRLHVHGWHIYGGRRAFGALCRLCGVKRPGAGSVVGLPSLTLAPCGTCRRSTRRNQVRNVWVCARGVTRQLCGTARRQTPFPPCAPGRVPAHSPCIRRSVLAGARHGCWFAKSWWGAPRRLSAFTKWARQHASHQSAEFGRPLWAPALHSRILPRLAPSSATMPVRPLCVTTALGPLAGVLQAVKLPHLPDSFHLSSRRKQAPLSHLGRTAHRVFAMAFRAQVVVLTLLGTLLGANGLTSTTGCTCTNSCNDPDNSGYNWCNTPGSCCPHSGFSGCWDYCTPPTYVLNSNNAACYLSSSCNSACPSGSACMAANTLTTTNCAMTPAGYNYACITQSQQGVGGACYVDSACLHSCSGSASCINANGLPGNPTNCASTSSGYNYICITPSAVVQSNGVSCYLSSSCQSSCPSGSTCTDDSAFGGSCYGAGNAAGYNKYACNTNAAVSQTDSGSTATCYLSQTTCNSHCSGTCANGGLVGGDGTNTCQHTDTGYNYYCAASLPAQISGCYISSSCGGTCSSGQTCTNEALTACASAGNVGQGYNYKCVTSAAPSEVDSGSTATCYLSQTTCNSHCSGTCANGGLVGGDGTNTCQHTDTGYNYYCAASLPAQISGCYISSSCGGTCSSGQTCTNEALTACASAGNVGQGYNYKCAAASSPSGSGGSSPSICPSYSGISSTSNLQCYQGFTANGALPAGVPSVSNSALSNTFQNTASGGKETCYRMAVTCGQAFSGITSMAQTLLAGLLADCVSLVPVGGAAACGIAFSPFQSALTTFLTAMYSGTCNPGGVSLANQQVVFYFSNSDIDISHSLETALGLFNTAVTLISSSIPTMAICDLMNLLSAELVSSHVISTSIYACNSDSCNSPPSTGSASPAAVIKPAAGLLAAAVAAMLI